jgi:hypothetical protein
LAEYAAQRCYFSSVTGSRSGSVGLYIAHLIRRNARSVQRGGNHLRLCVRIRQCDTRDSPIVVHSRTRNYRKDGPVFLHSPIERRKERHAHGLGAHITISAVIEGAAAPGWGKKAPYALDSCVVWDELKLRRANHGHVTLAPTQAVHGKVQGHER